MSAFGGKADIKRTLRIGPSSGSDPGLTWGDEDRVVLHTAPLPKDALLHLK